MPPFPIKQPTWFDGTTSRAETGEPFEPESSPFSMPASIDRLKTRITPFCAGEYLDSGFYIKKKNEAKGKQMTN